jgi:hypothetical protein
MQHLQSEILLPLHIVTINQILVAQVDLAVADDGMRPDVA